jgi:hypothetical protein
VAGKEKIVNLDQLSTIVALLAALSVAAERLVEIVKNMFPFFEMSRHKIKATGGSGRKMTGKR